ncbi:MAG: 50S ribosomal protein L6 [Candidatus Shikimatogenerans bostrichidophilus]|nr:MAG: 50S ribosomal protein L6 [Candidatus Shikimatogenerans bostrichidophilus]
MSKIGNKYIDIPKNVNIEKKGVNIYVKGKLGKLKQKINRNLKIKIKKNKIYVINKLKKIKKYKSLHGLYRMLIYNMIKGVNIGFSIKLELVGIGYNAEVSKDGHILILNIGFSHTIIFHVCKKISIKIENEKGGNIIIKLSSCDKQLLGIVASKIRSLKKPEPYKGKGIKYLNEKIIRKTGKTV